MKRIVALLFVLCIVIGVLTTPAMATSVDAKPSNATVYINGKPVTFEAYNINGSNYFKMRDLAMAFNATNEKFNIGYNESTKTVEIIKNQEYVPVGGELVPGDSTAKKATPGTSKINWKVISKSSNSTQLNYNIALGTYLINGNNFVKLRDLMQWVNVGVGFDNQTLSIIINTNQDYVLPKYTGNPLKSAEAIDNKYRKDYGAQPGSIQNDGVVVFNNGWYYTYGYRVQEGGTAVAYKQDYGDYIADNWQVYGDKVFFEGALSSSVTTQIVFSMNLDGSGLKRIITNALDNGQRITIYKGKLYANTHSASGTGVQIVSYNLDGTGRKVLHTGDLAVTNVYVGYGTRAYYIFNDRIYFMTKNQQIYSMKLDGTDKKLITTLNSSVRRLVNVYDGHIYYETVQEGLHRIKIDGTENLCVLPELAEKYAIYGDKIVYTIGTTMVGVVNTDGTSRYQFPNAKQDPTHTQHNFLTTLSILNSKYTHVQDALYNNDSAVPGSIRFVARSREPLDDDIRGKGRGWFPTANPAVNTLKDIIRPVGVANAEPLESGVYVIKAAKNPKLVLDISGSSRDTYAKMLIYSNNGGNNQKFRLTRIDDNVYTIKCMHSAFYWVSSGTFAKELFYKQHLSNDRSNYFTVAKQADGTYRIMDNAGLYLGISGGRIANGTNVILWTEASADSQTFIFEKVN